MMKKISLIVFITLFSTFSNSLLAQTFAGGDGTEGNPYQIETVEHLNEVRGYMSDHFILNNDIDLTFATRDSLGFFWNDGLGWNPIGSIDSLFYGTFDGNGYSITGLTINRPDEQFLGLITRTGSNARISNLILLDVQIIGLSTIGGLLAILDESTLNNIFVEGVIYGGSDIGMIVGVSNNSMVTQVASNGTITSDYFSGGLIGSFNWGSLSDSYSSTNIQATNNIIGGVLGYSFQSSISKIYAVGRVSGREQVGGIVGWGNEIDISGSYWNIESSGQFESDGGEGRKTAELLQDSTFLNWDFSEDGIWEIEEGKSYPYLKWQDSVQVYNTPTLILSPTGLTGESDIDSLELAWLAPSIGTPLGYFVYRDGVKLTESALLDTSFIDVTVDSTSIYEYFVTALYDSSGNFVESTSSNTISIHTGFKGGDGSTVNPYGISNVYQLQEMKSQRDRHFVLKNDIDASVTKFWNDSLGFEPIGEFDIYDAFSGTLNGNYFQIKNLFINRPEQEFVGLFGYIRYGEVYNLRMVDVDITGRRFTGVLAGQLEFGELFRISTSGKLFIAERGGDSGGILGSLREGHIEEVVSRVDIRSDEWIVSGEVSKAWSVGGVVGSFLTGTIKNSYSTGSIEGDSYVGGLVGELSSTLTNSYSLGRVSGIGEKIGGMVGNREVGSVTSSYWNLETANTTISAAGSRKSTGEMVLRRTYSGWDFTEDGPWDMEEGVEFPHLRWEPDSTIENDANVVRILSPGHQATIDLPYLFEWSAPDSGKYVSFQISKNQSFTELIRDTTFTDSSSILIDSLDSNTNFYWRVIALDDSSKAITWPATREFTTAIVTSVEDQKDMVRSILLHQNYPNPFNPTTTINFELPNSGLVLLEVFDIQGRLIATLVNRELKEGQHNILFDASSISSGVYIYRLRAGTQQLVKKMVLIK